jgi:small-conductance mechanosensitive channel
MTFGGSAFAQQNKAAAPAAPATPAPNKAAIDAKFKSEKEKFGYLVGIQIGQRRFSLLSALTIGVTVLLLFAGVRLANKLLSHSIGSARGFDPTQKLLVQKLAGIAVVVLAFFIGVDLLEIDLTAFTVFSGAFGLAIGFGLQKTIGNLIAGIILLMDRSIKPGDVIVVGDSFGWVNKIGVRAVSVITRDGKEHLIPNENLMTQEVENWSYTDRNVRVRIPVRVAYDCDLKRAQELMLRAAAESPRVLTPARSNDDAAKSRAVILTNSRASSGSTPPAMRKANASV